MGEVCQWLWGGWSVQAAKLWCASGYQVGGPQDFSVSHVLPFTDHLDFFGVDKYTI